MQAVTEPLLPVQGHERIQTLDGKPREYLRKRSGSDDEVQCLIPEAKKIIVEKRSVEDSFPSLSSASPDEILQRYEAKLGPVERVAGFEAQALAVASLPAEMLRVLSPSAEVQGHGPGQKVTVPGKRNVGIRQMTPTGNYAVRIAFDDGHDTGIFTWVYLRQLGETARHAVQHLHPDTVAAEFAALLAALGEREQAA